MRQRSESRPRSKGTCRPYSASRSGPSSWIPAAGCPRRENPQKKQPLTEQQCTCVHGNVTAPNVAGDFVSLRLWRSLQGP